MSSMGGVVRTFLLIGTVLVLIQGGCSTDLQLDVLLKPDNSTDELFAPIVSFGYDKPFTRTSANVPPEGLSGYVVNLGDGAIVDAVPLTPNESSTWVALVGSTPGELLDQLDRVRAAGYSMMLAYSRNNSNGSDLSITLDVMDSLFPVVFVEQDAVEFIVGTTLFTGIDIRVVVFVTVGASSDYAIVLLCALTVFIAWSVFVIYRCAKCCGIRCFCCNRNGQYDFPPIAVPAVTIPDDNRYQRQNPMARGIAGRLPVEGYDPKKHNDPSCPVCMGDFSPKDNVKVLPCHHNFHPECIDVWLIENRCTCPMCRQNPADLLPNTVRNVGHTGLDMRPYHEQNVM